MTKKHSNKKKEKYYDIYNPNIYDLGGDLGNIGTTLTSIIGSGISNSQISDTTPLEEQVNNLNSYKVKASDNDSLLAEWQSFNPLDSVDWRDIRGGNTAQRLGNTLTSTLSGIGTGLSTGGVVGAIAGGVIGLGSSIAGWIAGNNKAKNKANMLNNKINKANNRILNTFSSKVDNIDSQNDLSLLANYSAYGGNINTTSNQGLTNGLTFINEGGSHESNPNNGVPMGIDNKGIPNLVEEGEVKFDNYIFSNRYKPTKSLLDKYQLPTKLFGLSFAEIATKLNKESEERPNDFISKNGLNSSMFKLKQAQEYMRNKDKALDTAINTFSLGGDLKRVEPSFNPIKPNIDNMIDKGFKSIPITQPEAKSLPLSALRFIPTLGAGIMSITDTFGLTNKPDYTNANIIGNFANNQTKVEGKPLGDYLAFKPLDRDYYLNKLNAQSASTRSAIINNANGNRGLANAGLLALDYNTQENMGDFFRKADEYNRGLEERVASFNKDTNKYNSDLALRVALANKENDKLALQAKIYEAQLRDNADLRSNTAKSTNLTNLFDSLGDIGREEFARQMLKTNPSLYYTSDIFGNIKYKKNK